ncbi:MAG: 3-phosphoshikimate 1-carboxyvinyltransferase [Arenicellales bacterium]|jgi:3-phosphoshikimate 1-carboxyvinyltransferase|nr:3-phosphoshikimate 1-carboxyvinyltransferase [Arenicellales bacterium]MDP6551501.1 3-phosphoshikimate 1-carboxyvinyltransferase [Arenicellales bacterium]MDP6790985.1 3-phosphoshikimate 1-carboxyvinyltransferase [Arenicellales bacterium]MDP6918531.1 3-phosphoshikimate 1-carboxyvinyltransferase [Arenicellales bacterium]|tara:strand:+ start:7130 stop:8431 length:1302 start_codon:yes stop_codon:yes gene_type:complete
MSRIVSTASEALAGVVKVPSDKSISHRSVIFGAIADGVTQVSNLLEGEDVLATVSAFRDMGVEIEGPEQGEARIAGVGSSGLKAAGRELDLGNSGTSMRLLTGLLAGQHFDSRLTGDASLRRRPMNRVVVPLQEMGARVETVDGRPPLDIYGVDTLKGIRYHLPVASAQVKSAILLAGLYAHGRTTVIEPTSTRDHTERMLSGFAGASWDRKGPVASDAAVVLSGQSLTIPGDISSAAFFLVAASLRRNSDLLLPGVGINPTRCAVLDILKLMGADIQVSRERVESNEPVCDLRVRSAALHGIDIPAEFVANAIDEFPVIAVAAAGASGITRIRGASELRVKESDRIAAVVQGLQQLGVDAVEYPDGMDITGGSFVSGSVDSFGDHRIAMAFAVAGCIGEGSVEIREADNIRTSFPDFVPLMNSAGLSLEEIS